MFRVSDAQIAGRLGRLHGQWGEERALEEYAKAHSAEKRRNLAKEGKALSDGSYPIADAEDLKNAATLAASGHGNVSAAKALIRKRAKQLGVKLDSLPGFGKAASESAAEAMKTCPTCEGSGKVPADYKA